MGARSLFETRQPAMLSPRYFASPAGRTLKRHLEHRRLEQLLAEWAVQIAISTSGAGQPEATNT